MLSILRSDLNDMAAEIKRSFEYVLSCYPSLNITDLVLVGGSSAMRNLPEFLMAALGITVRRAATYVGSTSCRLHCDDLQRGQLGALALAIGLAVEE
ncbi:MAG: hypothetical protein IID42_05865 [Planctomycetes bacterium]|nr:hypothetical protein [Planctomycetota bacterium]